MTLSIIIPTLNEEKYLPLLLKSIKKQTLKPLEIILADARSKDETIKIGREFGCKIIKGGNPGFGRNNGAKIAKGEMLLFLDADVILPKRTFLEDSVNEIKESLVISPIKQTLEKGCETLPLYSEDLPMFIASSIFIVSTFGAIYGLPIG